MRLLRRNAVPLNSVFYGKRSSMVNQQTSSSVPRKEHICGNDGHCSCICQPSFRLLQKLLRTKQQWERVRPRKAKHEGTLINTVSYFHWQFPCPRRAKPGQQPSHRIYHPGCLEDEEKSSRDWSTSTTGHGSPILLHEGRTSHPEGQWGNFRYHTVSGGGMGMRQEKRTSSHRANNQQSLTSRPGFPSTSSHLGFCLCAIKTSRPETDGEGRVPRDTSINSFWRILGTQRATWDLAGLLPSPSSHD